MYSTTKKETTLASDSLKMYSTNQDYGTNSEISQGLVTVQDNQNLFDLLIFEIVDGKVNLTKICNHFGKRIDHWLKSQTTQRFLEAYKAITPNGGIETIKGGSGEQGTFGDRRIALKLAEWISVEFELFANEKLDELLQTGKATLALPSYAETLRLYADTLEAKEQLEANYQKALPKIAFHDQVATSINSITVGEFAKVIGTGEGRLFKWFKENGYLITSQQPYQSYIERGYFKVIEKVRTSPITGEQVTYFQVLVTGKGQSYFSSKFNT